MLTPALDAPTSWHGVACQAISYDTVNKDAPNAGKTLHSHHAFSEKNTVVWLDCARIRDDRGSIYIVF
jgi:hypothetical protein